FGSPQIAVWVLEELEKSGLLPSLVVTNPDAPQGRKMILTETPVAQWASSRKIRTMKPTTLRDNSIEEELKQSSCDLFVVAAYGKIIPENILNIPKYKTINMHPSLLPKLRGASPIRSAILEDMNPTGISIMILTAGMDEGPILAQEEILIPKEAWPIRGNELDELLAKRGGELLAKTILDWILGNIPPKEQAHVEATYSTKITKEMGLIDLAGDPYQNLLKIRAFDGWPGTDFFTEKAGEQVRIKIIDAHLADDGTLQITRIIPEGKKEMSFEDFMRS
ncbi:MAG: methionyl-tRNA formyltransferase, partial [Candidatus Kaiserbacteria bacterium]|nr:methionyl-tRNA formyltransferase [Candidatus Kaiserbacteria bacterium]